VTPTSPSKLAEIEPCLRSVASGLSLDVNIERHTVKRAKGRATVVDVWAPLRKVLGDTASAEEAETRLYSFVSPFLGAVT
jgi:hypothetical protein